MKFIPTMLAALWMSCDAASEEIEPSKNGFILQNVNIVDVKNRSILPSKTIQVENGKSLPFWTIMLTHRHPNCRLLKERAGM